MASSDQLHRFIFEDFDIRGEVVSLEKSYQDILANHDYPERVNKLLGEFLAAAGLLSSMLKFDGTLTLQARGQGPVSLVMADCTRHHNLRAIAQLQKTRLSEIEDLSRASFQELMAGGTLAITIDPINGERYQGIVPLASEQLAGCLEDYFAQSEQLPSRFWLAADRSRAGGLMLQALPSQKHAKQEHNREYWEHVSNLAATITASEQLALDHIQQLHRLFHQENLRLFDPVDLAFNCSCSRDRTSAALLSLGEDELRQILSEQGQIEIDCHFCGQVYRYSEAEISRLFSPGPPVLH